MTEAPKDGKDYIFEFTQRVAAYWDDELNSWVLSRPLHMECLPLGATLIRRAGEPSAAAPAATGDVLYRHVKRGTVYRVLHDNAPMQEEQTQGRRLDDEPMVVYQDIEGGNVYVRPTVEFYDGRFAALSPLPAGNMDKPTLPMKQFCPSCNREFENGGQCAAPVMRGGCPMGGDV